MQSVCTAVFLLKKTNLAYFSSKNKTVTKLIEMANYTGLLKDKDENSVISI